jgi:NAD(P)-dependent dehydrogenase (short-subunit alcohol dehydrogenase family)
MGIDMSELFSVQGRVALVTGGTSGIGAMIARGLLHARTAPVRQRSSGVLNAVSRSPPI